eukprot:TRINITY_DN16697_c0_g1::TRINITY_DN16697_c0_g1_i1::g.23605::m.23605 TRINITY_DN16697_c0_g1::TRINITY_DN16697_c0_g1_i1::g.23605  ORF type:complete len:146 (+),score=-10.33,sp/Q5R7T5/RNF41_PONAB/44.78/3e-30,zf-C3HC4/PF00097.20/4.2e-11,zf-C3HC4/PF00097.20/1.9e+03,zf-C3HC4_2/PF13923.1/2e-09,zf-C3HC4_2/PF13923.1/9.2e+02,zf-TRAF/PF02176.13/6e+03,zf-TRAF/PF02176.13/0.17,zf-TRAF/PF02176.13/1.6e-05,zf-TRAF/PF02176.13/0.00072,zf-C3HC4_3/PF13920.1/5.1e-09,zf-RING_2/PF13639.1/7.8e-09,zf-C3HC4_4/PF15227.1/4.2e-0
MNGQNGYDIERFVDSPDENLLCVICSGVMREPLSSPCGHSFCASCIRQWVGGPVPRSCPVCRSNLSSSMLHPVPLLVKSMLAKLRIKCEHKERGCEEIITLDRLESHLISCPYRPVPCPNHGCGATVLSSHLPSHRQGCQFEIIA